MKSRNKYLAHIHLEKRLAPLPKSLLLERNLISGVMGSERRDLSKLAAPFHREYANLPREVNAILKFTRRYGPLDWDGEFAERADVAGMEFSFHMEEWRERQAQFLGAWGSASNNPDTPWEVVPANYPLPFNDQTYMVSIPLAPGDKSSLIVKGPETLWELTEKGSMAYVYAQTTWLHLWMLLSFENRGNLRRCQNPECPAPYFIAGRKDQRFCGEDCAHLIAVRRWWTEHGDEWRRTRRSRNRKTTRPRGGNAR